MDTVDDQQFCLRWNNFQANITSQFETLRDDEDFTDVTIACDGQRLQAHKVVLSACSPFFKELFKSNPCSHPIIFMRDVEAKHIMALMEFMYAGEVNVAQAHLSAFLKTAESLKIRGLTDTSGTESHFKNNEDTLYLNPQPNCGKTKQKLHISSTMTVTSSQDINESQPPSKRQCKADENNSKMTVNPFALQQTEELDLDKDDDVLEPKIELPDYSSEEEAIRDEPPDLADGVEIIPQNLKESTRETPPQGTTDSRKLHSLDPRPCEECGRVYSNLSNLRQHMKLIHFPTIVQCPICKKPFKTDLYLRRHFVNSHDTKDLTLTTNIISNNCLDNKYNLRSGQI